MRACAETRWIGICVNLREPNGIVLPQGKGSAKRQDFSVIPICDDECVGESETVTRWVRRYARRGDESNGFTPRMFAGTAGSGSGEIREFAMAPSLVTPSYASAATSRRSRPKAAVERLRGGSSSAERPAAPPASRSQHQRHLRLMRDRLLISSSI